MAKNKKSSIPHYELLYIIPNKYTEKEIEPIVKKVQDFITNNGGKITFEEAWGNKKLAYPIKHFTHGYYNLIEFDLEGRQLAEVEKLIRMSSEIIRHQIVNRPFRTIEEINADKQTEKERRDAKKEKEAEEKKETTKKEEIKTEYKKETSAAKKKETETKKVDLEKLDEKLDKILETDDLL